MAFDRRRLRNIPCFLLAATLVAAVADGAVAQQSPASAAKVSKSRPSPAAAAPKHDTSPQSEIESASKLLTAGKTEPAVDILSTVISGGNLPASVMARALYLRGTAYRQQSKPALAISDLTSALWLKGGLSDPDRADATQQRAAAYSEAGLSEQGQAISAGAAHKGASTAQATPATSGGFFGGLFGGGSSSSAAPKEIPPPHHTVSLAPPVVVPPSTPPPSIALARTPVHPASAPKAASHGGYQSRIALVRTKAEADAVVAKLKVQYAAALADKTPDVGQAAFGNMGAFYQVGVGPFASAVEAQALCGKLKGSGLDCVAVSR